MKNNNAELFKYINAFHSYEFGSGEMLLIYKNNILIGYLCIAPVNAVISHLNQYLNFITEINSQPNISNKDKKLFQHSIHKTNEYLMLFNNIIQQLKSNSILDIALLEIIQEYRSLNTIKVIFNYLKQYCINNNFDFAWCRAKNKIVGRLYQIAGFKYMQSNKDNQLDMFLNINDKDYYEVTEKLKNKYKKNLFENMKDTKELYETIMTSVAKQVKKALNEGEYRDNYSSRENYEDEEFGVQGDAE